jgi:hypothetical protein
MIAHEHPNDAGLACPGTNKDYSVAERRKNTRNVRTIKLE